MAAEVATVGKVARLAPEVGALREMGTVGTLEKEAARPPRGTSPGTRCAL